MKVTYIDHMGTDLTTVKAAIVSNYKFNPDKYLTDGKVNENAERLINYLARYDHWTCFGHTAVTLHIKAPLFVARQLGKHQVGFVWNEVSRRYVDDKPEFYAPKVWRQRAANVKQGSSEEEVFVIPDHYEDNMRHLVDHYQYLLDWGVCPEQARMVLPQSMYTEWYWTGSVAAYARVCSLRLDPHTQRETQEIAQQINDVIAPLFPVSWEALMAYGD